MVANFERWFRHVFIVNLLQIFVFKQFVVRTLFGFLLTCENFQLFIEIVFLLFVWGTDGFMSGLKNLLPPLFHLVLPFRKNSASFVDRCVFMDLREIFNNFISFPPHLFKLMIIIFFLDISIQNFFIDSMILWAEPSEDSSINLTDSSYLIKSNKLTLGRIEYVLRSGAN